MHLVPSGSLTKKLVIFINVINIDSTAFFRFVLHRLIAGFTDIVGFGVVF
nr:hypothetical protein [Salinibacillus kushneri]